MTTLKQFFGFGKTKHLNEKDIILETVIKRYFLYLSLVTFNN